MENFIDASFKDDSPLNTVEKIKTILKSSGIETEETWLETKVPYCYSLSLAIKGIDFLTSGKGLSKEFALASAYGEMIERVQLGFLGRRATQKDGSYSMNDSQDIQVPSETLLNENFDIFQKMSDRLLEWNGKMISPQDIVLQYSNEQGNVYATPFVSLIDGKKSYIPYVLRKSMYSSNGCAAGNTIEEAIVQALSEIVERYYRLRIIKENICVPQVPDEVLQKYETPYKIIQYIRNQGYKVWVKDCSLGEKFPVLCVCFVNEATGRYHTHFGAYPIFEIALTRALTETFQGRNVDSFATYDDFFYSKDEKKFLYNLSQELTYGTAKRLPGFFVGNSEFEYNIGVGFKGASNKELLKECIDFFKNKGYNILVRNASCLGFPTVQVIIPGYSETYIHRLIKDADDNRYLTYAVNTLRNPSCASMTDMIGFMMHCAETTKVVSHPGKNGFLSSAKIMAQISKEYENFLFFASMAYVNFTLGKSTDVVNNIKNMLNLNIGFKEEFLICAKRYFELELMEYSPAQISELLQLFHNKETVNLFYDYINNGKNPFDEFVLHCDMKCDDSCVLKPNCCQKKIQNLVDLIKEKSKALSIDTFYSDIKKLIS